MKTSLDNVIDALCYIQSDPKHARAFNGMAETGRVGMAVASAMIRHKGRGFEQQRPTLASDMMMDPVYFDCIATAISEQSEDIARAWQECPSMAIKVLDAIIAEEVREQEEDYERKFQQGRNINYSVDSARGRHE